MPRSSLTPNEIHAMRARFVGLARELFVSEGRDAITFRRLADAAQCSHMLPYRYFAHKEALMVALRVECTSRFDRHVRAYETGSGAPLVRIRKIAAGYLDYVLHHPTEYQLIFDASLPSPGDYPELLEARQSLFDHSVAVVQSAIDAGDLHGNALELTHMFWVSLHGLVTLHAGNQLVHGMSADELVGSLMDRLLSTAVVHPRAARRARLISAASAARQKKRRRPV